MAGGVDREVAVLDRPAEDHAERHQDVPHRRRVEALAEEAVGEVLDVAALHVAESLRAELGEDAVAERALVAADRARLVEVARLRPHPARAHALDQLLAGLVQGRRRRRAELAAMDRALRFGAPDTRGRERREGLPEALLVAGAPRARLVGRVAVALPALARRAGLRVPDLDARELTHDPENTCRATVRATVRDSRERITADQAGQHDFERASKKVPANQLLLRRFRECPRQESNLRTRFRKPLLYPLSYGGRRGGRVPHGVPVGESSGRFSAILRAA